MSFDPSVFYDEGDVVHHRLTGWKGIVVGERNFGAYYEVVFLIGEMPTRTELEPALLRPDTPPSGDTTAANVIPVNFTKGVRLTPDTPTGGAA